MSVLYLPKAYICHYYHDVSVFLTFKDQSCNAKTRRSDEMDNSLFDTYKKYVIPHGKHMFQTAYDMAMSTMCAYL